MTVCLSLYLNLFIYLSVYLTNCLPIYISLYLFACTFTYITFIDTHILPGQPPQAIRLEGGRVGCRRRHGELKAYRVGTWCYSYIFGFTCLGSGSGIWGSGFGFLIKSGFKKGRRVLACRVNGVTVRLHKVPFWQGASPRLFLRSLRASPSPPPFSDRLFRPSLPFLLGVHASGLFPGPVGHCFWHPKLLSA